MTLNFNKENLTFNSREKKKAKKEEEMEEDSGEKENREI